MIVQRRRICGSGRPSHEDSAAIEGRPIWYRRIVWHSGKITCVTKRVYIMISMVAIITSNILKQR